MKRDYQMHGITRLLAARRSHRACLDKRTVEGRAVEIMRQELTLDQGGAENASAAKLMVIDTAATEEMWVARIDRAIGAFIKKHPEVLDNPRALAKLYGYRERPLNSFLKAIGMVGFDKIAKPVETLEEIINGDASE